MEEGMDYWEQKIASMFRIAFLSIRLLVPVIFFTACRQKDDSAGLPYYNSPDFSPLFLSNQSDAKEKITHRISNFSFTDQNGLNITEKTTQGKIHVANFFFTSCGSICPVMMNHMNILQQAFGNNNQVVILSFSVTPWIDNVGRLKKYALSNHITDPNWHLLTGSKSEIYMLARQSYFAEEDLGFTKDSADFLHTEHILLVDTNGRIRGIYNGTLQLEIEQLEKDINFLLKEEDQ
jgi:protein SCO1